MNGHTYTLSDAYLSGADVDQAFRNLEDKQPFDALAELYELAWAMSHKPDLPDPMTNWKPPEGGMPERLKKWLEHLTKAVKSIASKVNADSFSITVGTGVSVSVTFNIN